MSYLLREAIRSYMEAPLAALGVRWRRRPRRSKKLENDIQRFRAHHRHTAAVAIVTHLLEPFGDGRTLRPRKRVWMAEEIVEVVRRVREGW